MLRSSSRSGQWTCRFSACSSQLFRSSAVACTSLGYQASGTEMARPSTSTAVRVLSVTVMLMAPDTSISTVEVVIPRPQECFLILFDDALNTEQFPGSKVSTVLQFHWDKPELGISSVASHMDVWRFISVAGDYIESIRAFSQQRRHQLPRILAFIADVCQRYVRPAGGLVSPAPPSR